MTSSFARSAIQRPSLRREPSPVSSIAGREGFEPSYTGSKDRGLTAWRPPIDSFVARRLRAALSVQMRFAWWARNGKRRILGVTSRRVN